MQNFFNSTTAKVLFIGILTLLMLIPTGMIQGLINERQSRQIEATYEVSQKWGHAQEITGVSLTVPYIERWTENATAGKVIQRERTRYATFLPETLNYEADIQPELRQRGIYEVPVYELELGLEGGFSLAEIRSEDLSEPKWNEAFLTVGIPDTRGIASLEPGLVNGEPVEYLPGVGKGSFLEKATRELNFDDLDWQVRQRIERTAPKVFSGLHVPLASGWEQKSDLSFNLMLPLRGSQSLYLWPVGKETTAQMISSWPAPSFDGFFLPSRNDNDDSFENGFVADWNMSYFGRSFRQAWTDQDNQSQYKAMAETRFGVELIQTNDFYQKNERAIKYAVLFIGLMFLSFFCFEVLGLGRRLHPLQYLMVGCAMSVFYLLVLAFSEIIGFGPAYWGAALATTALVTGYSSVILSARRKAFFVGGLMVFIYGYLYTLLQLETFALAIGSVFMFVVLAGLMWVTRQIDWYSISGEK